MLYWSTFVIIFSGIMNNYILHELCISYQKGGLHVHTQVLLTMFLQTT